jgi:uncharacterized protein with beta-barrel porin domain
VGLGSATFTGNFTVVSKCTMDPLGGTWTKDASAPANVQATFIAIGGSNSNINTVNNAKLISNDPTLAVLLYATGTITGQNDVTLAAGAVYAHDILFKNKPNISRATSLGTSAPPGFTFDPSTATTFTPVVRDWRETV